MSDAGVPVHVRGSRSKRKGPRSSRGLAGDRLDDGRFRVLFEQIPAMCFTLRRDGVVLGVNALGAEELGYGAGELIGKPVTDVFHVDDRRAVQVQLSYCLDHPGAVRRWDLRKVRKNGSMLWVREAARAVRARGDWIVLVLCEDVTERKVVEQRLVDQQQRLQTLASDATLAEERERQRIATGLHDHVGQNLALAKRQVDALRRSEQRGATVAALDEIDQRIGIAIEAIRSLTFELSSPILHVLGLEAALKDLGRRIVEGHGLRFRFETDGQPKLLDDATRAVLFRAGRELLLNIVKHARAQSVTLRATRRERKIRICVMDDGVGMAPDRLVAVGAASGGFGLWNARRQLVEIDGELVVEVGPQGGLRVVLEAPLATCEESA